MKPTYTIWMEYAGWDASDRATRIDFVTQTSEEDKPTVIASFEDDSEEDVRRYLLHLLRHSIIPTHGKKYRVIAEFDPRPVEME